MTRAKTQVRRLGPDRARTRARRPAPGRVSTGPVAPAQLAVPAPSPPDRRPARAAPLAVSAPPPSDFTCCSITSSNLLLHLPLGFSLLFFPPRSHSGLLLRLLSGSAHGLLSQLVRSSLPPTVEPHSFGTAMYLYLLLLLIEYCHIISLVAAISFDAIAHIHTL